MADKLTSLKLEKFKAFKDATTFDIGTCNLLVYGENGAGKSSVYDALKLVFFYKRISESHKIGATPEEQRERLASYLSGIYAHRNSPSFSIEVDSYDYLSFTQRNDYSDYNVSMICNTDIQVGDYISYKELLENTYLFGDVEALMADEAKLEIITKAVNKDLKDFFKEDKVYVAISVENDWKCCLKGPWSEDTYIENIRDYFNEAIINLIILVLLFNTIKVLENNDKPKIKILVLDDIITSLDASNRVLLMRYVQQKFSNYQKFVFTHNISFYNLWIYTINNVKKETEQWKYMNIYDCGGKHKVYEYKQPKDKEKTKSQHLRERLESGTEDLQDLGNDMRRYFEELLHEFSKIVHVGGKNECSHILDRLESGKAVYLYKDGGIFKTADDMVDHLKGIIGLEKNDVMIETLRKKMSDYKANQYFKQTILPVVKELRLYQKLSMHPLSHAHLHGTPTYTEKELRITVGLLEKFESVVNELKDFDVSTV